jgi:hypothetical protein
MYRELIAPYVSDETRELDFSRQKMLRVYWRELAPVIKSSSYNSA